MTHRAAVLTVGSAAVIDTAGGLAFAAAEHIPVTTALYWAVATGTTVGYGDVTPHNPAGRLIAVVVMLTAIPLFGAAFSLFTSGLAAGHVRAAEQRMKHHLEERLAEHHKSLAVVSPARRAAKPNGSSERMATPEERT
jgi:voltage-gated potassium channel Kch